MRITLHAAPAGWKISENTLAQRTPLHNTLDAIAKAPESLLE
jgi:hypothetical protein